MAVAKPGIAVHEILWQGIESLAGRDCSHRLTNTEKQLAENLRPGPRKPRRKSPRKSGNNLMTHDRPSNARKSLTRDPQEWRIGSFSRRRFARPPAAAIAPRHHLK